MAVWSIVNRSELGKTNRIDPEYYQPELINIGNSLSLCKELRTYAKKITDFGAYSQMNFVEYVDSGIKFLRNQNINEFFLNEIDSVHVSPEVYEKLSLKLEECDIITPRVGTLGNAAIIFEENLPATANQNLAQIKPNKKKIDPVYLAIFLCSRYGKKQFERSATGNVQPWLNLEQLKSVKIYEADDAIQKEIANIALEAREQYKKSIVLYSQAEEMLLDELGLTDFDLKNDLFYVSSFRTITANNRMDAEYYMPKYEPLMKHINAFPNEKLGKLAKLIKGIEPGSDQYIDSGKPFIRVSNLSLFEINSNNQKYLDEGYYAKFKEKHEPHKGEMLLSKDATPGIAYVLKDNITGIISGGILRLVFDKKMRKEYIALIINSQVGQLQMRRDSGGAIITHWKPDQIKNLIIPLLDESVQDKIEDLCVNSFLKRKESIDYLNKAKRKVEEAIEQEVGAQ